MCAVCERKLIERPSMGMNVFLVANEWPRSLPRPASAVQSSVLQRRKTVTLAVCRRESSCVPVATWCGTASALLSQMPHRFLLRASVTQGSALLLTSQMPSKEIYGLSMGASRSQCATNKRGEGERGWADTSLVLKSKSTAHAPQNATRVLYVDTLVVVEI